LTNKEFLELVVFTHEREWEKENKEFAPIMKRIEDGSYPPTQKGEQSAEEREDRHRLTEHINYQSGMQNLAVRIMEQLAKD
jgi:hypothetical protein